MRQIKYCKILSMNLPDYTNPNHLASTKCHANIQKIIILSRKFGWRGNPLIYI